MPAASDGRTFRRGKRSSSVRHSHASRARFDETAENQDFRPCCRDHSPYKLRYIMKVEIFTLCDAATNDAGGKLNILGSFDRLMARQEPITHPQCALAIKLRFERVEEGEKRLRIALVNSDGKPVMPTIDAATQVKFTDDSPTATASVSRCAMPRPSCRGRTSARPG